MAISVPSKSAQYVQYSASPMQMVKPTEWGAVKRASVGKLTFTAAGFTTAAAGDLQLIRMPAGRIRILERESLIVCPAGTATADLDVGYGSYRDQNGVLVAGDGDGFAASLDVGGGAINAAFNATGVIDGREFYSQDGFDIVASVDTANSPASGDLIVLVTYLIGR